jgi:transcriptional regulator with XRE-family HTH domain
MTFYRKTSRKFYEKVKLDNRKQYELAEAAGISNTYFSQVLLGIRKTRVGDERIKEIGKQLDLKPEECWEEAE